MSNFLDFFRKPIVWIYISVIYICFFAISILIATVGPPFVIAKISDTDSSLSFTELKKAFLTYAQEGAKRLDYNYEYVLYSIISNIIVYSPALIVGFFVLRKKMWARNAMIVLIIVFLFQPVIIRVVTTGLTIDIFNINTLIYIGMIFFLTRKKTKAIFLKVDT